MSDVTLSGNGVSVTLRGGSGTTEGIALTSIEGWYSTPGSKTSLASRATGDGDHDVQDESIIYESRVVSLGYRVIAGASRSKALETLTLLDRLTHANVKVRVSDDGQDTYCTGFIERTLDQRIQNPAWQDVSGVINVTCPRPERLSWRVRSATLVPLLGNSGGLSYGSAGAGLVYPLDYGVGMPVQNQCVLTNAGSSPAFPVFTVQGPFSGPVRLVFSGSRSGEVGFEGNGERGAFVLDSRSRTMSMNGSDVSRRLSSRGFVSVPPGGSVTVTLLAAGDGWCRVEWRDTWM